VRRGLAIGLALLVALALGLAAVLWLEGPRLLEHAIRRSAHFLGYQDVRVGVRSLGLRSVDLERFSAGPAPGLEARDVTLRWTGRHLLAGRVASVEVGSAVLHGEWNEDGIVFPVLPPAPEDAPWLSPPVWDRVQIAEARVELGGSQGPVSVRLRGVDLGAPPGERLRAHLEASVDREAGRLTAVTDVVLDGEEVNGHATVRSADGSLELVADLGAAGPPPGRFPELDGPEDLKVAGRIDVKADGTDLSPLTPSFTAHGTLAFRLADGRLRVDSDGLDVAGFGALVSGLSVAVELTQVAPPAAPPGQTISVETLDFGMNVGGGTVRFGVDPGGVIDVQSLDWRFQGGTLRSQGRFDPGADANGLVVAVEGVDLGRLVADLGRDDLAVTGRISGELPLRIEGDRIFALGGRLKAGEEGGVIRYQAGGLTDPAPGTEEPPGSGAVSGVQLVVDALKNFQYRTLEVEVGGELTGEMLLRVKLEGSNPAVYDGYPIQLNLNLEGPLADVVQGSTTGFRVQDAVEKRFQQKRGGK
jgi:hypothetical protein